MQLCNLLVVFSSQPVIWPHLTTCSDRKLCFIITWQKLKPPSLLKPERRTYRAPDECWERRSWGRTWRSPRRGRTRTSPAAPCRWFCAVEENINTLCLKEGKAFIIQLMLFVSSEASKLHYWDSITDAAPSQSQRIKTHLLLQLLNVLLPVLVLLRDFSVGHSFNLILISVKTFNYRLITLLNRVLEH